MTDFGRKAGEGDMLKSVYDPILAALAVALAAHKTQHQNGGTDEIAVAALSGELADDQPPKAHNIAGTKHAVALRTAFNAKIFDANFDDETTARPPAHHGGNHAAGQFDPIDTTGLVGRVNYVDRGDPTGWDKTLSDFTTDGAWHDLNLSALVPAGAISIHVQVYIEYGLQGSWFHLRKKGNTYSLNRMGQKIQSMGFGQEATGFVDCDVNRTIEYRASAVSFSDISLLVKGWLI